MTLRNPNETPNGGWKFYFQSTEGGKPFTNEVSGANSVDDLTRKAALQMTNMNVSVPENLKQIVEHQICTRAHPGDCWMSGIGDELHNKWIKPFLTGVAKTATKMKLNGVAKKAKSLSGCSSCGGTSVYVEGENNLGRAGTLNDLLK